MTLHFCILSAFLRLFQLFNFITFFFILLIVRAGLWMTLEEILLKVYLFNKHFKSCKGKVFPWIDSVTWRDALNCSWFWRIRRKFKVICGTALYFTFVPLTLPCEYAHFVLMFPCCHTTYDEFLPFICLDKAIIPVVEWVHFGDEMHFVNRTWERWSSKRKWERLRWLAIN